MSSGVQPQGMFTSPQTFQNPSLAQAQQFSANQFNLQQQAEEQQAETAVGDAIAQQTAAAQAPNPGNNVTPSNPSTTPSATPTGSSTPSGSNDQQPGSLSAAYGSSQGNPAGNYLGGLSGSAAFKAQKLMNQYENQQLDTQIKTQTVVENYMKLDAQRQAQIDAQVKRGEEDEAPMAAMLGIDKFGNMKGKPSPEQLAGATQYLDDNLAAEVKSGQISPQAAQRIKQAVSNPDGSLNPDKVAAMWRQTNAFKSGVEAAKAATEQTKNEAEAKKQTIDANTEQAMRDAEIKEKQAQAKKAAADAALSGGGGAGLTSSQADTFRSAKAALFQDYGPTFSRMSKTAQANIDQNIAEIIKQHPDWNGQQIAQSVYKQQGAVAAWKDTQKKFADGKQGDVTRSLNVVVNHLDTLGDAVDKQGNVDQRQVNEFKNFLSTQFGATGTTDVHAIAQVVAGEIMKATGGSVSVTETENILRQLDTANTPEQLHSAINRFKELAGGQLKGLRQQYVSAGAATGLDDKELTKDFNSKLFDSTRTALGDKPSGSSTTSSGVTTSGW